MKRVQSFKHAWNGMVSAFRTEPNLRIHLGSFFLVLVFGCYFRISTFEWLAVLLASGMVFTAELLNTALEKLCDAVHPEQHKKIGAVKDVAAAAVLVSALMAAGVGGVVFWPKFIA